MQDHTHYYRTYVVSFRAICYTSTYLSKFLEPPLHSQLFMLHVEKREGLVSEIVDYVAKLKNFRSELVLAAQEALP